MRKLAAVAPFAFAILWPISAYADWAPASDRALSPGLLSLCLAAQPPVSPNQLWSAWSFAPSVILPLVASFALYVRGYLTAPTERPYALSRLEFLLGSTGFACLAVAVVSPLCRMAATVAWAHMIQHVLLISFGPLFLILGRAGETILNVVAGGPRSAIARPPKGRERRGPPTVAFLVLIAACYGVSIWLWHIPRLYEAALLDVATHLTMYAMLLAVSLAFWHGIVSAFRNPGAVLGAAALMLFLTFVHTGVLGALLTMSGRLLYPLMQGGVAWGLSPMDDQQLAGLIMWVPMGLIYFAAALALLARLIGGLQPTRLAGHEG